MKVISNLIGKIKNVRRNLAIVLSAVLFVSAMLTGCGNESVKAGGESDETVVYSEETTAEPLTIGYTFWDMDIDGFVRDQANQIKLVAEALNVNLIFNPDTENLTPECMVSAADGFAKQGVDGMIVVNFSDETLVDISDICQESEIPFIQATRTIADPEVAKKVESNPYYIGRIHESEYAAAYEVGRKLIDNGSKKMILLCPEHGDVAYEARAEGFRDACEEPDVEIVEERWELADDEVTTEVVKELLNKYPDVDGIFSVRCGFVQFIVKAEEEMGLEEYVPIVGVDFDIFMGDYMKSGAVLAVAGGHHPDASLCLITLVNAIRGVYGEALYPIDINYNMLVIDRYEDFEEYKKWCIGYQEDFYNAQILNMNDARSLCVDYNPNTSLYDITVFAETMSLDRIKERHKGLISTN